MKKVKALTLIETLLVIVVIALILMVATNQFQRYQQARNIQQAKTAVQMLSAYGSQLYLSNCANMAKINLDELICPSNAAANLAATQNAVYCNNSFNIVNPFVHQGGGINYVIVVDTYYGIPLITIGLPMSSSFLGKMQGKSGAEIVKAPLFQKYMGALQPTVVAFKNEKNFYFPAFGWQSETNMETDVICTSASEQDLCLIWRISPANWGTVATDAVSNQSLNNQLNAFATQYVPTSSEWQTIQSDNSSAALNCPAINAQTIQKINKQ